MYTFFGTVDVHRRQAELIPAMGQGTDKQVLCKLYVFRDMPIECPYNLVPRCPRYTKNYNLISSFFHQNEKNMSTSQAIVKFNVGGTRYEVARSLIETRPDTMIARMISKEWRQNPDAEVFIERDGSRFKYFLVYLRDGKVSLPVNVSRESVLDDLKYYGIDGGSHVNYDDIAASNVNSLFLHRMKLSEEVLSTFYGNMFELQEELQKAEAHVRQLEKREEEASDRVNIFRAARIIFRRIINESVQKLSLPINTSSHLELTAADGETEFEALDEIRELIEHKENFESFKLSSQISSHLLVLTSNAWQAKTHRMKERALKSLTRGKKVTS